MEEDNISYEGNHRIMPEKEKKQLANEVLEKARPYQIELETWRQQMTGDTLRF